MTKSAVISYQVGAHRPVLLWAGPGTVRMNKLKFTKALVDGRVHMEAHTPVGAERMSWEASFNCAYLTYDWGFPPEVAQEDWRDFQHAARVYQAAGIRVFGSVQISNYIRSGSYMDKEWYARDPKGRPYPHSIGRTMTCWTDPEWLDHLREMVQRVVASGGDGIFFDNLWHGAQPIHLAGAWLGGAGCYCQRCQAAFQQETGLKIPKRLLPDRLQESQFYLRWRAEQVTQTLSDLAWYARSIHPQVQISANNFDAVMQPSYVARGIDLPALADIQNVLMIESPVLPRWQVAKGDKETPRLLNNALTLHTAQALAKETPITTLSYDQETGFEEPYPPRRYRQGIAETAACGSAMVVKGTGFYHQGRFTLLTALKFSAQRQAIGQIQRWLLENEELYRERQNAAAIGLLYPGETLWQSWDRIAPIYFGVGQALLASGVPWRVLTPDGDLTGLEVLLSFEDDPDMHVTVMMEERLQALGASQRRGNLRRLHVPSLPGWQFFRPGFLGRHRALAGFVGGITRRTTSAYFTHPWARRLGDRYGLPQLFLNSAYFHLPPIGERRTLMEAIGGRPRPFARAEIPILVEHWLQGDIHQLHLVNYAPKPQQVSVDLPHHAKGQILSPDGPSADFNTEKLDLTVDAYTVLRYRES